MRPRLLRVDGVADVVSYGGLRARDPRAARSRRGWPPSALTLDDLEEALTAGLGERLAAACSSAAPSSSSSAARASSRRSTTSRASRVATREGTPVFVARRGRACARAGRRARAWSSRGDDHDAVEGIVLMRRGENPSRGARAACASAVDAAQRAALAPTACSVEPFYDRTELVDTTLETVGHNLLEGAVLVTLVLFVFLLDLRAALIVAALIPLSLLTRVHLPAAARHGGQPALDGRGRLRHHRRRRRW